MVYKLMGFVCLTMINVITNALGTQSSLKITSEIASANQTTINEPLLLLLFGLLLFSVATGIKLKLLKR